MHALYSLKDKLIEELKAQDKRDLNPGSLETIDKLAHAAKNLCKIIMMCEEDDYSFEQRDSYRMSRRDGSYEGGSNRMSRRGSYRNEYSRHYGKEAMIQQLEKLADESADESVRQSIERCISQLESA